MKLIVYVFLFHQLFNQCVYNDRYIKDLFQAQDFAPVGAGQNEVFYSNQQIYKEIRMPKKNKQHEKKFLEFQYELEALKTFSNEFYIAGLAQGTNQCTFSYIAADIINLEEDFQNFTPFRAQKWEDFYYYQDRLVRHRFMTKKKGKAPNFSEVLQRLKKDKDFYLTYFLKMKQAQGDLYDMLQDESTQNWGWRLDISLQLIRYIKLFRRPRFNKKENSYQFWHHLDIKPENILMQDFYTPLIADLGNASKDSQLFNGSLKGTTAFLDPTIITLELFYQPETDEQKNLKMTEIQNRYQKADQYALGATLLKILMPHVALDYDANTYSSNIQEILQGIESQEEQAIIGFLRNLLTDHYQLRSSMEQAEKLIYELIYYLKNQLGDSLQLVQYLENQFDFYLINEYDKTKKKLWENYKQKIQKYQEYYNILVNDDQQDVELENFFERFNKITNNKSKSVYRQKNVNKPKVQFKRMETVDFFQAEQNFTRSKTIAANRQDLLKNGIVKQAEIIGNEISIDKQALKKLRTKNYDKRNSSYKRSFTINDLPDQKSKIKRSYKINDLDDYNQQIKLII